mgnify:CR=1 FL=1
MDPRLFKAAPPLSNKKLVRNALRHVCLAGAAMRTQLDEALRALDAVVPDVATVFVILFRENTSPHKYRALYALVSGDGGVDDVDGVLVKIHGTGGPARIFKSRPIPPGAYRTWSTRSTQRARSRSPATATHSPGTLRARRWSIAVPMPVA